MCFSELHLGRTLVYHSLCPDPSLSTFFSQDERDSPEGSMVSKLSAQNKLLSCDHDYTEAVVQQRCEERIENQRHWFRLPIQSCGSTQTYNTPGEAVRELQHRVRGGRASGSCWIQHRNTQPAGWHITMATRHSAKQRGSCQTCARAASGSEVWSHWVFFASSFELVFNVCASETWKQWSELCYKLQCHGCAVAGRMITQTREF